MKKILLLVAVVGFGHSAQTQDNSIAEEAAILQALMQEYDQVKKAAETPVEVKVPTGVVPKVEAPIVPGPPKIESPASLVKSVVPKIEQPKLPGPPAVSIPSVSDIKVPTVTTPNIKASAPKVIPTVSAPRITAPTVTAPAVTGSAPKITAPTVTAPRVGSAFGSDSIVLSDPPVVTTPKVEVPTIGAPKIEVPAVSGIKEIAKESVAAVDEMKPAITAPKIEAPKVTTPKVEVPEVKKVVGSTPKPPVKPVVKTTQPTSHATAPKKTTPTVTKPVATTKPAEKKPVAVAAKAKVEPEAFAKPRGNNSNNPFANLFKNSANQGEDKPTTRGAIFRKKKKPSDES